MTSSITTLADVVIGFEPDVFVAKARQGDNAAFSAKFAVELGSENEKKIEAAMLAAATMKWKDAAPGILAKLKSERRVAYQPEAPLDKDGKPYSAFMGKGAISTRNAPSKKPALFDTDGNDILMDEGQFYAGARVHASIEFWAQDSAEYGRRINCNIRAVKQYKDGERLGGASPATANEFAGLPSGDAGDFV